MCLLPEPAVQYITVLMHSSTHNDIHQFQACMHVYPRPMCLPGYIADIAIRLMNITVQKQVTITTFLESRLHWSHCYTAKFIQKFQDYSLQLHEFPAFYMYSNIILYLVYTTIHYTMNIASYSQLYLLYRNNELYMHCL